MNPDRKIIRKELQYIIMLMAITFLSITCVFQLWNKNMTVPVVFDGDGLGAVVSIKSLVDGENIWEFPRLSAPYGDNIYMQDFVLEIFIIKFFSLFTKDIGILTNMFWLFTYVMTGLTTYILCRKLKLHPAISILCSTLYNFLPYHYFRTTHYWLFGCYMIPIALWMIIELMQGNYVDSEIDTNKLKWKKLLLSCFLAILLSFNGLYYAVFTIILLGIAGVYAFFETKSVKHLCSMFVLWIAILLPIIVTMFAPVLFMGSSDGNGLAETRSLYDLNLYSLSLIFMLLPIPGHRVRLLANITQEIYQALGINENHMVALGTTISVGMIISIVSVLFWKKKFNEEDSMIVRFGKLNIWMILIAISGGLDIFIGYFVSSSIRCYNRMSVFIALLSMITIGILLQKRLVKKEKISVKGGILIGVILILGILDQTSPMFAKFAKFDLITQKYSTTYSELEEHYYLMKEYIGEIEDVTEDGGMIFQLPINEPSVCDGHIHYTHLQAYVLSNDLKWSANANDAVEVGSQYEWKQSLLKLEPYQLLEYLAYKKFSGILIDKSVYSDTDFQKMCSQLEKKLHTPPLISDDGNLFYYNIEQYRDNLLDGKNEREINTFIQSVESYLNIREIPLEQLNFTGAVEKNDDCVTIKGDVIQYGPYYYLNNHEYVITVLGDNLEHAIPECTAECGGIKIDIEILKHTSKQISYKIVIEDKMEQVEFKLSSANGEPVTIEGYYYEIADDGEFDIDVEHSDLWE